MKKYILLMIAGLLILFSICIDLAPNLILPIKEKLIIYIIAMLLVYIDTKMKNKREENKIE